MQLFKDDQGHEWTIAITVGAIKRVKALLPGIDLAKPDEGKPPLIGRLPIDPVLLCDVIYCLVKPAADAANITDEQFGEAMGGDALAHAAAAFWEEYKDFFQRLDRHDVARLVATQQALLREIVEQTTGEIEKWETARLRQPPTESLSTLGS